MKIRGALGGGAYLAWLTVLFLLGIAITAVLVGLIFFVGSLAVGVAHGADISRGIGAFLSMDGKKIAAMGLEGLAPAGLVLTIGGLVLTALFGMATHLVQTAGTRVLEVQPLLPVGIGGFILTDEGIYTWQARNILTGKKCYLLRPWGTLALSRVNERAGWIALRHGSAVLRLQARPGRGSGAGGRSSGDDLAQMKQVIQANLGSGDRPKASVGRRTLRWVAAAVAVGIVLVADLSLAARFADQTKGKVGDQACDVDGRSLAASHSFTVMVPDIAAMAGQYNTALMYRQLGIPYSPPTIYRPETIVFPAIPRPQPFLVIEKGKVVNEYCEIHGLLYAAIHPLRALELAVPAAVATAKEKGFGEAVYRYGTIVDVVYIWVVLITLVVAIAAPRTYLLRQ